MYQPVVDRFASAEALGPWLVCLDLQREFTVSGRPLYSPEATPQIDRCRQALSVARGNGWTVTHCHTRRPGALFRRGSQFVRPIVGLEPLPSEQLFYREALSAFLPSSMRAFALVHRGCDLAVAGFSLNESLLASVVHAADLGLNVTVLEDAVALPGATERRLDHMITAARQLLEPMVTFLSADEWTASHGGPTPSLEPTESQQTGDDRC